MSSLITGHTRLIAHLGVPTESFRSPMIYNPYFAAAGIDVVVVPMGCEAVDFPGLLRHLARLRNFAGALITMPHKITVAGLLDEASSTVRVAGACNAVRTDAKGRLIGDMFDGEGFVRGARRNGCTLQGASALVIGTGGVGSAIAASLALAGAARIGLFDTDKTRCDALARRLGAQFPALTVVTGTTDLPGWDIVVNATPLGMTPGDALPADPARLDPATFVGDVVMTSKITPFLQAALDRGCKVQPGTDMLFEQIPAYLDFFGLPTTTADILRQTAQLAE